MLWNQCSTLLVWSTLIGHPWMGLLLSLLLLALEKNKGERVITDAQLQSLSDFSFVFLLVVLIVINNEVDRPMEAFILTLRWSPLIFSPWMICRFFGRSDPVTLGTLIVPLRYRVLGLASLGQKTLDLAWPTSFLCLLASSTCEGALKDWYYPALSVWGGFVMIRNTKSSSRLAVRLVLLFLSMSLGYGLLRGIQRTESYLSQKSIEWINRNSQTSNLLLQTTMLGQTASLQLSDSVALRYRNEIKTRLPLYLKKSHFDQWLGTDTWFCTDPMQNISPDPQGWIARVEGASDSSAMMPTGTLWFSGEGTHALPLPASTTHFKSTALSQYKRMSERMIKAHSDREWVKVEVLTTNPTPEKTQPHLLRDLNVNEKDTRLLSSWLNTRSNVASVPTEIITSTNLSLSRALPILRKKFKDFQYNLNITKPKSKISPLEHFLMQTQEGHCEYFATSVTLLLRTMGIPSRYCSGFLIDEQQGDWLIARGQDAHAWCEAWNGQSWVVVDLTPNGTMPSSWFRGAKDLWDEWMFTFNDWRFGGTEDQLIKWAPSLLGLVLLYFSIRLWSEWRKNRHKGSKIRSPTLDRPDPGFAKFEKKMKKKGLVRLAHESYGQWAKRLEQQQEDHPLNPNLVEQWNLWAWSTPTPEELKNMKIVLLTLSKQKADQPRSAFRL
jgi:hypothetical protein